MRLCCPPHAVIQVAKLKEPFWRPSSQSSRSFTSTVPPRAPHPLKYIQTDGPLYKPQAQPNIKAKNVAVVGGGITGLAAVYNLTKALPNAKITLFEAKKKLGGWLDSELVPVDNGEVLFEWGPRTLRNDNFGPGRYTAQLIAQLDMAEDVIPTSVKSSAALNRYIYYPDHLVRMPGPLPGVNLLTNLVQNFMSVLQEPIFKGALGGLLREPVVDVRPSSAQDESVGDFVTRRFGRHVADNLVSALLHGIYAGDLYKLSARTILPLFWHLEEISESGIVGVLGEQMWKGESLLPYDDMEFSLSSDQNVDIPSGPLKALDKKLEGSSVYTFKKGLAQLAEKTEAALRECGNVEIKNMTAALEFDSKTKQFCIRDAERQTETSEGNPPQFDYVVATISPSQLSQALKVQGTAKFPPPNSPFAKTLRRLKMSTSSVNVMVVNLFYRDPNLIPVSGFGYLLPRSLPLEQNPERALGVIFGSETSGKSSDIPSGSNQSSAKQDSVPGTKLTVMLGGHWWTSWSRSELPDEEAGVEMAKAVLERHLGITDAPIVAKARMQWNAIPQYEVGHHERMARIHRDLRREFAGRLKVAGSAYQGVGVNDCVKAARKASLDIREALDERTGLEAFGQEMKWAIYRKRDRIVYMSNTGKRGEGLEGG